MPDHFRHCIMRFNPRDPAVKKKKRGWGKQIVEWRANALYLADFPLVIDSSATLAHTCRNGKDGEHQSKIRRKTFNESLWVIILFYIALVYLFFFFSNPKRIEMDRNLLVDFSLPIRLSSNFVLFLTGIFDSLELMQCRVHFWIVRDLSLENKYMIIKRKRGRRWQGVVAFYIDGTSKVARSGIRIIVFQKV